MTYVKNTIVLSACGNGPVNELPFSANTLYDDSQNTLHACSNRCMFETPTAPPPFPTTTTTSAYESAASEPRLLGTVPLNRLLLRVNCLAHPSREKYYLKASTRR